MFARFIFSAFLFLPAFLPAQDIVQLVSQKNGQAVTLCAVNHDPYAPYHADLEVEATHMTFGPEPPPHFVVKAGQALALGGLAPDASGQSCRYRASIRYALGEPDARPDTGCAYHLPFPDGKAYGISQGYFGPYTHQDCRCLDFDMPEGSVVCAARGGRVITVKDDFEGGGPSLAYADKANVIEVLHPDGTWATYAHLKPSSARVKLGQVVQAGQVLALSGHTGQADGPHLHFVVNRATWKTEESLATVFRTDRGLVAELKQGEVYRSGDAVKVAQKD
jgi:murein DD-endopeptidase MepM/ murein hydrolase activator NlpD